MLLLLGLLIVLSRQVCQDYASCSEQLDDSANVGIIYSLILDIDGLRQRRSSSQMSLVYDEQIFELYEEDLENQIKRNKEQYERCQLIIDKYFTPKKACLEGILDSLIIMDPIYENPQYDYQSLNQYFYSRDQLQFRSSCYSVILAVGDQEIESLSKSEIERLDLFEEYYEKYQEQDTQWGMLYQEIRQMDYRDKLEELSDLFSHDPHQLEELKKQLLNKSKGSFNRLKQFVQPQTEIAISIYDTIQDGLDEGQRETFEIVDHIQSGGIVIRVDVTYGVEGMGGGQNQRVMLLALLSEMTQESRDNMIRLVNATNSDTIKLQEEEEFRVSIILLQRISMKFMVPRKEQDL